MPATEARKTLLFIGFISSSVIEILLGQSIATNRKQNSISLLIR